MKVFFFLKTILYNLRYTCYNYKEYLFFFKAKINYVRSGTYKKKPMSDVAVIIHFGSIIYIIITCYTSFFLKRKLTFSTVAVIMVFYWHMEDFKM